jgi:hypothetical protein
MGCASFAHRDSIAGDFRLRRFAAGLLVLAASLAAGASPAGAQAEQEIDLLFTQTARDGSFKRVEGKPRHTLTMRGVSQTIWFQNAPGTQTGQEATSTFVDSWEGFGFVKDPPNASLSVRKRGAGRHTVVVALGNPRFKAETHRVRYRADPLARPGGERGAFPHNFDDASLTIDNVDAVVVGDCVIEPFAVCQGADLSGADLDNVWLTGADLSYANLTGTALRGAIMEKIFLDGATLTQASLIDADLTEAFLRGADLSYADFQGAILRYADMTGANLSGADFTGATFLDTTCPDGSEVSSPNTCS